MRIAESVNAVGGQGRAVSAIQKCWKGMRLSQRQQLTWLVDLRRHLYRTRTLFSLSWVKTATISMGLSCLMMLVVTPTHSQKKISSECETKTDLQVSVMKPHQVEHIEYFDNIAYSPAHEMLDKNNIEEHHASHNGGQSQQTGSSRSSCSSQLQNHSMNQTSVSTRNPFGKTTSKSKSTSDDQPISKRPSASSSLAHWSILQKKEKKRVCDQQGLEEEKVLNEKWLKSETALNVAKLELIQLKKNNLELETQAKVELMQLEKKELVLRIKKLEQDTVDTSNC